MDRLLAAMQATGGPCLVQLALTPTPTWFERSAKEQFKRREQRASPERMQGERQMRGRPSEVDAAELRGALDVQHRPLFFGDLRIVAATGPRARTSRAVLRTSSAENQLVERGTTIRQALLRPYDRRVARGEGNPLPGFSAASTPRPSSRSCGSFLGRLLGGAAATHGAADCAGVTGDRASSPTTAGCCATRSDRSRSIPSCAGRTPRCPGTVEQGKTSYLVATIREDLP